MRGLIRSGRGASGVEYGMVLALVAIISLGAVEMTGGEVQSIFDGVTAQVATVDDHASAPGGAGEESEVGDTHFLVFTDKANVDPDTDHFSNSVIVPEAAEGASATVSGDASCALWINGAGGGASAVLTAGDELVLRSRSSAESLGVVSCSVSTADDSGSWALATVLFDTTPNAFTFADLADVNPGSEQISDEVILASFDGELSASVDGGAVLVIDGSDAGASASVSVGQSLAVRAMSPAVFDTAKIVEVTVGDYSTDWVITTRSAITQAFGFTGSVQNFVVPDGVSLITMKAWGAGGGGGAVSMTGGGGGYSEADVAVSSGETLSIAVGGGGGSYVSGTAGIFGGGSGGRGGKGGSAGGGGYSGIFLGSLMQADALLVAGGGGGAGNSGTVNGLSRGAGGGGLAGQSISNQVLGGTQTSGGAGPSGNPGGPLVGGNGSSADGYHYSGAGGGGGYFGGAGAKALGTSIGVGGAGGSGYSSGFSTMFVTGQGYDDPSPGTPGNDADPDYASGVGVGGVGAQNGGNGYIVLMW